MIIASWKESCTSEWCQLSTDHQHGGRLRSGLAVHAQPVVHVKLVGEGVRAVAVDEMCRGACTSLVFERDMRPM